MPTSWFYSEVTSTDSARSQMGSKPTSLVSLQQGTDKKSFLLKNLPKWTYAVLTPSPLKEVMNSRRFHTFCSPPNIASVFRSSRMTEAADEECVGEMKYS